MKNLGRLLMVFVVLSDLFTALILWIWGVKSVEQGGMRSRLLRALYNWALVSVVVDLCINGGNPHHLAGIWAFVSLAVFAVAAVVNLFLTLSDFSKTKPAKS